jgi:superfamily II DNA or RNA helicase
MDLRQTISSSNNWLDLKAKIDACFNTKHKGDIFELLTKLYLQIDPRYVSKLTTVWLYNEIPTNTLKKLNLPTKDMGIDLIAETNEGEYWAIQCKYKADESKSLTWREISTFQSLAFSKAKGISFGLVATTVDRSANVFKDQKEDVKLLAGEVWRDLDVEFFKQAKKLLAQKIVRPIPFQPRKHQQRAVSHAYQHFVLEKATRGKMIMPCGTGKSLTSYWIAKELEAKTVVIAVPSLSLINQTLKAWLREVIANMQTVDWIAICSDKTAGEVDSAISTQDLGIPTNTDPEIIAKWLRKRSQGLKVVFTTYQSGKVLAEASRIAKRVFDLGIMDEAHKTVGDRDKTFAHLLSDENIKIRKRVFMTATERRYAGNRDEIISMDNPEVYGDTFELLTFKEALEQEPPILSDYKILTMLIHKEDVAKYIQKRAIVKPDRGKWDDGVQAEMLAGVVALNQAMEKYPIKHAVSFHTSITKAQAFRSNQQTFTETIKKKADQVETFFVSGKTPTSIRARVIKEFASSDKALISNARCLTEGVDVPNIDGVLFADPKRSAVDIVQAVGRALRLSDGKDFGYIIIPVLIEDESDFENSGAFQTILTVLRALASNDERIVEYFRDKADNKPPKDNKFTPELTECLLERVNLDQFVESIELQVWNKLARLSWRPFNEAREYVTSLGLKSRKEWREYINSGKKPADIPDSPRYTYRNSGWISMGDWLGTGTVATYLMEYRPFRKARSFAQSLGLENRNEWHEYSKSGKKPKDIPATPEGTYKDSGWISFGDWLGTGAVATSLREFRSFDRAREFARSLDLNGQSEWKEFCKSGEKPEDIPSNPNRTYLDIGWLGFGDWLGTGSVANSNRTFITFTKARKFARSLGFQGQQEWFKYTKSGQKPVDIPAIPSRTYMDNGWKNWGDWLGTGNISNSNKDFKSFQEARLFVRSLGLKRYHEWAEYSKSERRPVDIPASPDNTYKNKGWISWADFFGVSGWGAFLPFKEARSFARSLKLKKTSEWEQFCKSGQKPDNIPASPRNTYKDDGWIGFGDWLGTGNVSVKVKKFRPFGEAREYAQSLGLKGYRDWREYFENSERPIDVPAHPNKIYADKGWISWSDFLGNIGWGEYRSFTEASKFAKSLKFESLREWKQYSPSGQRPEDIPSHPETIYKDQGWSGWPDFLGYEPKKKKK